MAKTVTVRCALPNGLRCRLYEKAGDQQTIVGEVVLRNGENPGVDAEFMEKWAAQNEGLSVLVGGQIHMAPDKETD